MNISTGDISGLIGLLPTAVILISAIIYYFGVRWGETQVAELNVASQYYMGVLFIISYMLEPYLLLLFVKYINEEYIFYSSGIEKNTFLVIGVILEVILLVLFQYGTKYFRDNRKSLDNFVECKKINLHKWLINLFKNFILTRSVPFIIIFIIYGFYILNMSFEIKLLFLILAFLTFTHFAFCVGYSYAYYRKTVLHLKNGKIINGIIMKYGSYVNVLAEDGTYSINKDDISTIEVSKNSKELCYNYFAVVYKK